MENTGAQSLESGSTARSSELIDNWVKDYNRRSQSESDKIKDYGQIHFALNDRTSQYIRYPFKVHNKKYSGAQVNVHEQRQSTDPDEKIVNQSSASMLIKLPHTHLAGSYRTKNYESATHILHLLCDIWQLPPPKLIISVTGGTKFYNLAEKSRISLQKGLFSVAITTDAWVFTGGTHAGVMKDVGEAFEKWAHESNDRGKAHARVPVIGIVNWHRTTNNEQLKQGVGKRGCEKLYRSRSQQNKSATYSLDPNHTHFILLDDACKSEGKKQEYSIHTDNTLALLLKIEREASEKYTVPIIQIPINGGHLSLLTVIEAIKNKMPVIVVKMITSKEGFLLINIFSPNPDDSEFELGDVIFNALLRAANMLTPKMSDVHVQKFILAMTWKKYDMATSDMVKETSKTSWTDNQLDIALINAIQRNSVLFVEFLIQQGASFNRLRQLITITNLYKKEFHLQLPIRNSLIEDIRKPQYYYEEYLNTKAWETTKDLQKNDVSHQGFIRDILLWSIFAGSLNLPMCLCSHSPNTIVAALITSKIYKRASELVKKEERIREYRERKKEFDEHAAQIIDKCFSQDENLALNILTTKSELYFDYTPIELAEEAGCRAFLASRCVQTHADQLCQQKRTAFERLKDFFIGRAIVRFYYNVIFYIVVLGLFSFVMLVDYFPYNNNGLERSGYPIGIPITEIILHLCIWGLIIEEIVQFQKHYSHNKKNDNSLQTILSSYFLDDAWNTLDAIAIFVYLIGFFTRFIVIEAAFIVSKIFMCIDLCLWYVRILHLFAAYERLGPKLLMIGNTMKDLAFFLVFLIVFLAAYAISSYSLITTSMQVTWNSDGSDLFSQSFTISNNGTGLGEWTLLRNVLGWGIWKIFGQVDLTENEESPDFSVSAENDAYGNIAFVLTIIFVCIANVLLLNILVALFNITLIKTTNNVQKDWPYHRFRLVREYWEKSPIPSPLNIIYYIGQLVLKCFRALRKKEDNGFRSFDNHNDLDADVTNLIVFNADNPVPYDGNIRDSLV
ncbi:unnamed protein product [Rotaria sordida]|uniref:Transient receptor potential cation channel subfamily M member 2 n=1 Tax=Rotaria sordida TaxID=392033 RepID=A0A813Z9K6_9BILA|nr:unnamed protein product [Rotaria sordida]CAF0895387.1 unnamed protein product [Rotaria sordida]